MKQISKAIRQIARQRIPVSFVTARLHQPINDVETKACITKSRPMIEQRTCCDARDVTLLVDAGVQRFCDQMDRLRIFRNHRRSRECREIENGDEPSPEEEMISLHNAGT